MLGIPCAQRGCSLHLRGPQRCQLYQRQALMMLVSLGSPWMQLMYPASKGSSGWNHPHSKSWGPLSVWSEGGRILTLGAEGSSVPRVSRDTSSPQELGIPYTHRGLGLMGPDATFLQCSVLMQATSLRSQCLARFARHRSQTTVKHLQSNVFINWGTTVPTMPYSRKGRHEKSLMILYLNCNIPYRNCNSCIMSQLSYYLL